jgi:D-tagatose-1,6-bisphosphate aldolase subunit GatZ/KbaZ
MYLNEIVSAQKRGEARGITSICSAHPWVLKAAMQENEILLIESTCNQVNQFGGYTGMTPAGFVQFVRGIATENDFPFENIILGGDHLGPNVWQNETADLAMQKSAVMIKDYIQAGFQKIHLDCSMPLADDSEGALDPDISAQRAAFLAKIAEASRIDSDAPPLYVIGTEVPIPGGAKEYEEGVRVTKVEDVQQTIEITHRAFIDEGLESAWERVIAVVVQPGVEFGDDFVLEYDPIKAKHLTRYIANQSMVYEAHSTDYQTQTALGNLVRDHFAILKVGPALTFAFREAIFNLATMENELFPEGRRSNLIQEIDKVMVQNPEHWQKYLHGTSEQLTFARKYSLSDRIRYYWPYPQAQVAIQKMLKNLHEKPLPISLLSQFANKQYEYVRENKTSLIPEELIVEKIQEVLQKYRSACQ